MSVSSTAFGIFSKQRTFTLGIGDSSFGTMRTEPCLCSRTKSCTWHKPARPKRARTNRSATLLGNTLPVGRPRRICTVAPGDRYCSSMSAASTARGSHEEGVTPLSALGLPSPPPQLCISVWSSRYRESGVPTVCWLLSPTRFPLDIARFFLDPVRTQQSCADYLKALNHQLVENRQAPTSFQFRDLEISHLFSTEVKVIAVRYRIRNSVPE